MYDIQDTITYFGFYHEQIKHAATFYVAYLLLRLRKQTVSVLCLGESPSICPFLKNNGDETPKGPSPIIFQE